jgi:hypothetical protein
MKAASGKFISQDIAQYLKTHAGKIGSDYTVIGIIGAQSSGKSTLLNAMFNSNFSVMQAKEKRKQTTRGIWTNIDTTSNIMILDIEGADSRERWEEKHSYERKTALFGLVVSNILIINVWLQEIGRFTAANYEILRTILELNVQFFNKETPKKILFVIRDFNDRENFDYIREILISDVTRIWSEVKKPQGFEGLQLDKLFKVETFAIHNYVYERPRFDEDVQQLAGLLKNKSSPDYLFKGMNFNNIPLDGLYVYMSQIWETIISNKDVNIPNQKIMVSTFRCNEIKNESIDLSRNEFDNLRKELGQNNDLNLREQYDLIFNKSLEFYSKNTTHYDETIARSTAEELKLAIQKDFETIFREQNDKYVNNIVKELDADIRKIYNYSGTDASSILAAIVRRKNEVKLAYRVFLEKYRFEQRKLEEYFNVFNLKITNLVTGFLSSSTNSLFKKMVRGYATDIDNKVYETFRSLNAKTWADFNTYCSRVVIKFKEEILALKNSYEEVQSIFTDDLLNTFEKDLVFAIKNNLQAKRPYIGEYMLEEFKSKFELSSTGTRRNWRVLEDSQIDVLFQTAKKQFSETLTLLEESLVLECDAEVVVGKQDCAKIKTKFESDINDVLEQAYNKKYNRNSLQRVPKWLWIILAYFMHDNILEWMKSPIVFGLLIVTSVAIGYLYATDKIHYVTNAIWMIKSVITSKALGFGGSTTPAEAKPESTRKTDLAQEVPDYK